MPHEQIKPNTPDQSLYPRLDAKGNLTHEWVSTDQIFGKNRSRLTEEQRRVGIVRSYLNRAMQWVPELRDVNEESAGGWKDRVVPEIKDGKIDAAGTLIRGTDIQSAQNFVHPNADLPIASGSALSVTAHRKDTPDPYGLQVIGETAQEIAKDSKGFYGRISRASKYNNGEQREDIVVSPILPGTLSDSDTRITPADLNSMTLPFKSHAVDFMSVAYFDPQKGIWTVQNVPYGNYSGGPWQTPKNYGGGAITGSVAYQLDGGIYMLNPDAHIDRFLRNTGDLGFTGMSEKMILEMFRQHLIANKRWIPSAEANIENPNDPNAETFGNRYYLRYQANSDGFAPPLATGRRELVLVGTPAGIYKKVDTLNIVQLEERPVNIKTATRKDTANYQEPVKAFQEAVARLRQQYPETDFHEALFTAQGQDSTDKSRRLQEGTSSNFAIVSHGRDGRHNVIMPDARDILDGTTVKLLAKLAEANGWDVVEREITLQEMRNADEVISTGTAMGFKGVGTIRNAKGEMLFTGRDETPVTRQLQSDLALIMLRRHPNTALNSIMTKIA